MFLLPGGEDLGLFSLYTQPCEDPLFGAMFPLSEQKLSPHGGNTVGGSGVGIRTKL